MWITLKDENGKVVMDTKMTNRELWMMSQVYKIARRQTIACLAYTLGVTEKTAQKYMRDKERAWEKEGESV